MPNLFGTFFMSQIIDLKALMHNVSLKHDGLNDKVSEDYVILPESQ